MATTDSQSAARLGAIVTASRDEIERRWLEQVRQDVAGVPPGELSRLREGVAEYLAGLGALLMGRRGSRLAGARNVWLALARARGVHSSAGFDIEQLVRELVALGRVIRDVAAERGVAMDGPEGLLADALDTAIAAAIGAYVRSRDQAARRREARHVSFLTHELRNPLGSREPLCGGSRRTRSG